MDSAAQMPSGWTALLWGILTFSLLVVVHEGGHFALARLFKIKVLEFMIGLPGPAVRLRSRRTGTAYGITMVPLGGYVRIAGMEPGDEDPLLADALAHAVANGETDALRLATALDVTGDRAGALLTTLADWGAIEAVGKSGTFRAKPDHASGASANELLERARALTYRGHPTWHRILILTAGVFFNLLTAWLIFTVTLSAWGYDVPSLTIESVVKGSAASKVDIRPGDRIVEFDGVTLEAWSDLQTNVRKKDPGDEASVTVRRDGRDITFEVTLTGEEGHALLGVGSGVERKRFTVLQAARESLAWTGLVFVAIGQFFDPSTFAASVRDARSVVGISYEVAKAVEAGPIQYAWMVAFLSLSLGAVNILPLPPLDGGKVLVEVIERVRRRPLRREIVYALSAFGGLLLLFLISYLMYADVMRYIVRG